MISLKVDCLTSDLTQRFYDDFINSIDVHSLACTCGSHDNIIHGYYNRKVRTDKSNVILKITRIRCKQCGKTHALLLSLIIPYKSVSLSTSIRILKNENIDNMK